MPFGKIEADSCENKFWQHLVENPGCVFLSLLSWLTVTLLPAILLPFILAFAPFSCVCIYESPLYQEVVSVFVAFLHA